MRRPFSSKRALTLPVRLRRVASGLMIDSVRSAMERSFYLSGNGGAYSGECGSGPVGQTLALLPLPAFALLPVGPRVACRLLGLPAPTCRRDGAFIAAVEDLDRRAPSANVARGGAVGQDEHRRSVGVLLRRGQPDRLILGEAVAARTMRQEGAVVICPQRGIERLDPLGRA